MDFVLSAIFLTLGFIIGLFVYAQMLLPLIYGIPKSVKLFVKGDLIFMGIISQFITPVIWFIFLIILGFMIEWIYPPLNGFLILNPAFNLGGLLSILVLLLNSFSPKGRNDMRIDFQNTTYKRYKNLKK